MFEEITGIPAHPLLVHAPVVFVPLLVLLALAYAFVPFVRSHTRLVLGLFAVVTPISALFAKLSGDAFFDRLESRDRISQQYYPRLEEHGNLGNVTLYTTIVLAVLALALVILVAPKRATNAADHPSGASRVLPLVLGVLALVAGAVSLYYVIRTGHTGAHAVWDGA